MRGFTLKRSFVKDVFVLLIFASLFVSVLCGCGKSYNDTFKNNQEAADMMEEAIYSLQLCIDGKIGVDRIGGELSLIADKYEGAFEDEETVDLYRALISVKGIVLDFYAIDWRSGDESTAGMMKRVKEVKAELENALYK